MHTGDPCLWLVLGFWGWEYQTLWWLLEVQWGHHILFPAVVKVCGWKGCPGTRVEVGDTGLTLWDVDVT